MTRSLRLDSMDGVILLLTTSGRLTDDSPLFISHVDGIGEIWRVTRPRCEGGDHNKGSYYYSARYAPSLLPCS